MIYPRDGNSGEKEKNYKKWHSFHTYVLIRHLCVVGIDVTFQEIS